MKVAQVAAMALTALAITVAFVFVIGIVVACIVGGLTAYFEDRWFAAAACGGIVFVMLFLSFLVEVVSLTKQKP
jgi:hypothetical protein